MDKIAIIFQGGESRNSSRESEGVNYMLGTFEDEDGEERELYAEVDVLDSPYAIDKTDWNSLSDDEKDERIRNFDSDSFDEWSHPILKEQIIRQAIEYGLSENDLEFDGVDFD